MIVIVIWCD